MKIHSKRRQTHLFILIDLLLLVLGCVPVREDPIQSITTVVPTATLLVTQARATPLQPAQIILTPTTPQNVELALEEDCIPIEENMPDDLILSGVWIRNRGSPYLETMDGRTAYGVPLKGGVIFSTSKGDMAVSPDGRHLAYIDSYLDDTGRGTKSRILRIINSSGHSLSLDYWIIDWQWLVGWTDNQHIAILTGNKELLLLEPFTGEGQKLQQPSWLDNIKYDYYYYGYQGPFYNPSLDRILIQSGAIFTLKDVQTGKTIYRSDGYLFPWDLDWSADGSTLVIGLGKLLNVVTRDEQVIELDASKFGIKSVNYPRLSPNGQKLVFTSYWSGKLFLFDIKQSEIRKLYSDEFNYWENAVWSPDSRFVVHEVGRSNFDQFDLLIDTQQMRAYKLISEQYQHRLVWLTIP